VRRQPAVVFTRELERAMSTEQALLAAVLAKPYDDLPRLIYADWLEESGHSANLVRATFIRVQCELARIDEDSHRWKELKQIETQLWTKHRGIFRKTLDNKLSNEPFHRGFVAPHRRMIVLDHLLNWSDEKLNRAPLWEFHVNFRPTTRIAELCHHERLRRLGFIGLWTMNDEQAVAISESPHAMNLRCIHCRHGVMTAAGIRVIAHSQHLPHLSELILDTHAVDLALATAIVDSPMASRLQRLRLENCDRVDERARRLLAATFMKRLTIEAWS
jgi:uncharacterized protein (TIGR02996 family)